MNLTDSIRTYLNVFYFLGLSPHKSFVCEGSAVNPLYLKLPLLAHSLLLFYLCVKSIISLNTDKSIKVFGQTEIMITLVFLAANLIRSLFIFREGFFYQTQIRDIILMLNHLQHYILQHLKYKISNRLLIKKYLYQCFIVMGSCLQYLAVYIAQCISDKWINSHGSPIRIIQLLTAFALLHATFYIDLLEFYLAQLNCALKINMIWERSYMIGRPTNVTSIRRKLFHYKTIHFRLCEVAERVSVVFASSLMLIMFELFVAVTYSMYWLFEEVYRKSSYTKVCRESIWEVNLELNKCSLFYISLLLIEPFSLFLSVAVSLFLLGNVCECLKQQVSYAVSLVPG